ncbi:hypothetical protein MHYP_G00107870 [Metynnis hypsauchen]
MHKKPKEVEHCQSPHCLLLVSPGLVEGVELNEQFISVKAGENVTLSCKVEKSDTQVKTAESLNYAPIHFKENKPKPGRVKRQQPEDIVYSQVRSSNAKAHRSHR